MRRINSVTDALTRDAAQLDLGDNLRAEIPLGKRTYSISQTAGRTVLAWDYVNSREQLIYGDTGMRDITDLVSGVSSGRLLLQRTAAACHLIFDGLTFAANGSGTPAVIPSGFRPVAVVPNTLEGATMRAQVTQWGNVQIYNWTAGVPLRGFISWPCPDPWPATLPGTSITR